MDTGLEAEIPQNGTGSQGIESEPEPNDIRVFSFFELNATCFLKIILLQIEITNTCIFIQKLF
jgi:hypothetical protein